MSEFINTIDVLGDDAVVDSIIDRTITEFKDNSITTVESYAFSNCKELTSVHLPNVTFLSRSVFEGCSKLTDVDLPELSRTYEAVFASSGITTLRLEKLQNFHFKICTSCQSLTEVYLPIAVTDAGYSKSQGAFQNCKKLSSFYAPNITEVSGYMFYGCSALEYLDFPVLKNITSWSFFTSGLKCLALRNTEMVTLAGKDCVFPSTSTRVLVPSALLESYKVATNWSNFASQLYALEDFTVDGTITGEIDKKKI